MRTKNTFFLLCSLMALNVTHAQTMQGTQETTTNNPAINQNQDEGPFIEGNSMENRRNRGLQLSLGPGIEFGIPIFSYTIGYFLKQNAVLTARYSERHDYTGDEGRKGLTAIKLGYKKFAGNSFFYQPSIYYRNTTHITSVDYNYRDMGLGLRIGNEWQWENFMLGIDWLGVNHHIVTTDEKVHPNVIVPNSIDVDKKFSFDFVGLYIGYTF